MRQRQWSFLFPWNVLGIKTTFKFLVPEGNEIRKVFATPNTKLLYDFYERMGLYKEMVFL